MNPSPDHVDSWRRLSSYLHAHWRAVVTRGSFDLSQAFGVTAAVAARHSLNVHLHFVAVLAEKLRTAGIRVDLASFLNAMHVSSPHPEITLLVADADVRGGGLRSYTPEVSVLRAGEEVQSALWMHLEHPVAVKICWLKQGAPVSEPEGFPWHPARQRKIVKLSPYEGDTRPLVARRDLRI